METPNQFPKVGFFEEKPGVKSNMRLMCFILLIYFCAFNFYYVISKGCPLGVDFTVYSLVILGAIFTPKYLQKMIELKLGQINPLETK